MRVWLRYLVVMVAALAPGQDLRETSILRPHQRSLLPPGETIFIGRAVLDAQLLVDGKEVPLVRPGGRAVTAAMQLSRGAHQITLIEGLQSESIEVMAGFPGDPAPGYRAFKAHPPEAACLVCHRADGTAWTLREGTIANGCFTCHQRSDFQRRHTHAPEVLEECQRCHYSHGSTEAFHLRIPKEAACRLCHK